MKAVYLTTGTPLVSDITQILEALLQASINEGRAIIERMRLEKGYALQDILQGLFEASVELDMPRMARHMLMPKLSDLEYRLSRGATEKMQIGEVCAAFF